MATKGLSSALQAMVGAVALPDTEVKPAHAGDEISAGSEEWAQQMRDNEEADAWGEQHFHRVPIELQPQFEPFLGGLPAVQRIQTYRMIDKMDWNADDLLCLYNTIKSYPAAHQEILTALLNKLDNVLALRHAIRFFPKLSPEIKMEMLNNFSQDYIAQVIEEITRFLTDHEQGIFVRLSNTLGLTKVLSMLETCKEPWADKCRLCRKRKLYALHLRLEHRQVPPDRKELVGSMELYDKAEKWIADDEKGFHFDIDNCIVFWEREIVDMIRICDTCLQDVFAAASCCTRFEPLYNIPAKERKLVMAEHRAIEKRVAELFGKIFITSVFRRLKEFSIRATRAARHGLRLEADERLRLETLEKLRLAKEKAERERAEMIANALSVDKKWKLEDQRADNIAFKRKLDLIDLNTHISFSKSNPAPKLREHPLSWRLKHTDAKGLPITDEAAAERFGLSKLIVQDREKTLGEWKEETIANHNAWLEDQKQIKAEEDFARHIHCDELKQYVDFRTKQINRTHQRLLLTLECAEENRISQRLARRHKRRDIRIAGYEAEERAMMEAEDYHSKSREFYDKEVVSITNERKAMEAAHHHQCSFGDKYWGIDLDNKKKREMEARLRALWEAKVNDLRDTCIRVRITRPFAEEVRKKVFRDKITNKVIK